MTQTIRNAGTVLEVTEDVITFIDLPRNELHEVSRGAGFHAWIDDGVRGNH